MTSLGPENTAQNTAEELRRTPKNSEELAGTSLGPENKWHACPGSDTLVIGMAGAGGEPDEAQGFLHLEEAGEAQRRGDGTHSHINGLGRQPGELYVGIPAF